MLFSEIYSCYYNAVAKIIAKGIEGELDHKAIKRIVRENAFAESAMDIPDALSSGRWPLLYSDNSPVLADVPNMPLTVTVPGTATATPTPVPKATATPVPTMKPSATPILKDAAFSAEILGDSKIKLVFSEAVDSISVEDIHLSLGRTVCTVESVSLNTSKTEAVLHLKDVLTSGKNY